MAAAVVVIGSIVAVIVTGVVVIALVGTTAGDVAVAVVVV